MSRVDQLDIMVELTELCRDLKDDVLQQLNYYRASVYKEETSRIIEHKIEQLRTIIELTSNAEALDLFADYEATRACGNLNLAPGECPLSSRIMTLFSQLDSVLEDMVGRLHHEQVTDQWHFSKNIQKNRKKLLSICRQGSRQWAFFQAIRY